MSRNLSEKEGQDWEMAFQAEGPAMAKVSMSGVQEVICLGCWSGLEVAGGAVGELRGQTMKGHLCGIESAPYPVGSEIPLKGFEQEGNMARFGF